MPSKKQLEETIRLKERVLQIHVDEMDELRRERNGYLRGLKRLRVERRAFLRELVSETWKDALQTDQEPSEKHKDYLINKILKKWKEDQCG